jgi:hypothetical protein
MTFDACSGVSGPAAASPTSPAGAGRLQLEDAKRAASESSAAAHLRTDARALRRMNSDYYETAGHATAW